MRSVTTNDNSVTFYNEEYQEYYHSLTGALEEAQKKYIEPLHVKDGDVILDICFGLGYNTYAALEAAKNLKIIALERDKEVLKQLQQIELPGKYSIIKHVAKEGKYKDSDYDILLLFGSAEETIKMIDEEFDVVFLDPFSPKKNPELWTEQFFAEIYKRMKYGSKLGTYSCAAQVRKNLKAVGFIVEDGPAVRRRGPSTIATKLLK